jgi:hypothetical protein
MHQTHQLWERVGRSGLVGLNVFVRFTLSEAQEQYKSLIHEYSHLPAVERSPLPANTLILQYHEFFVWTAVATTFAFRGKHDLVCNNRRD